MSIADPQPEVDCCVNAEPVISSTRVNTQPLVLVLAHNTLSAWKLAS